MKIEGRGHDTRLVAGGGRRGGQVFATLYQRFGIDVATTRLNDLAGRPHYLVGEYRSPAELVG